MRTLSRTWTTPLTPVVGGLSDARSTGAAATTPTRKASLNDRRSTR